jgi:shikimate kinase
MVEMVTVNNIFLVGPMGSGKSSIGKRLAEELNLSFYDSDSVIEERTGVDIAWIFDAEGEQGFRKREAAVIDELTQMQHIVLATGGGAVITPENRTNLAARGTIIFLRVSIEQQLQRTARDRSRPLLQCENPEQVLRDLAEQREPLYQDLADYTFDTNLRSVRDMVYEIVKKLRKGEQE